MEHTADQTKGANSQKIIVYSTPTCPYCGMVKQYFDENNVKYTEVDVSRDEKAAEDMVKKSGQMGVPVIDVGGQIVVGFNQAELTRILGLG
ncbi:glutaredoxin family protein [Patescibacteria group bacterium]|nr:glutaredoxin family protein [Patescibacteria group bacterium]MBU1028817.1 glutaredoxin family protein [Patescibacteria group bacterium]MBU1915781.1 glutaredoxin family protein [Patescibacteria group bacterium]